MIIKKVRLALLVSTAATAGFAGSAQAATTSGTIVSNTASVTYTVGGAQTTTSSNAATFVVDKKVNLTVAEVGGLPTYVSLGGTDQVTTFTVTNQTNSVQDFKLDVTQTLALPILGTANFNVTNVRIYVDNGDGVFGAGDTQVTYLDELAADATKTVFVVANIPASGTPTPNTAIVSLNATTEAGGTAGVEGAALVATVGADSPTTEDIVFADTATANLNIARDGMSRAFDSYVVSTATVSMVKSSVVLTDPINLLVTPKAIPGATVQYCIVVSNAGPQTATNVNVSDFVPANVTYVPGSLTVGGASVLGSCVLGSAEDDDTVGADESDPNGGSFDTASTTVHAMIPTLTPGLPETVAFNVIVK